MPPVKSSNAPTLSSIVAKTNVGRNRSKPLWKGPTEDGVTFSMLSRFLVCRERFRLYAMEGFRTADDFNHRIHFGHMWHVCEEEFAKSSSQDDCMRALKQYASVLCNQYPMRQKDVQHWYNVCKMQFPYYIAFWKKHPDMKGRKPLYQEKVFNVPYKLPSGRFVRLRGKWDSIDLVTVGKQSRVWLMENKTKGMINEQQLRRQLTFDLQTMLYLVALGFYTKLSDSPKPAYPIAGVRYNVIRRPLSGGAGTIKQREATLGAKCTKCKGEGTKDGETCSKCNGAGRVGGKPAETSAEYYSRLGQYIKDKPEEYFMRWNVEVTQRDVERFRTECLDPILEQLCDWYTFIAIDHLPNPFRVAVMHNGKQIIPNHIHWRHPFGVYNVLDEGGSSDVDEYLASGSEVGLRRVDKLFEELT